MILEQVSSVHHFSSNGSGSPLLGTPFFNTALGREDFDELAVPLAAVGRADVVSRTKLYGGEANFVANLYRDECWNVDVFGGFRFLDLEESLDIATATSSAPGLTVVFLGTAFPPPAITGTNDHFQVHNQFYGGQLGGRFDYKQGNWILGAGGRVALGVVHEVVDSTGFSTLNVGPVGPVAVTGGGVYAQATNGGRQTNDTFAVVPEVEARVGYQFNSHLCAYVGYTFLYMSDVVRPGDQVDHRVNPNQVPTFGEFGTPGGGNFPARIFSSTDYYIHGINFSIEVRF